MATTTGADRYGGLPRRSHSELRTAPPHSSVQAADLYKQMDPFEVGYLELDIIKELLLRVKNTGIREEVEELLHQHVFSEGSFLISKEDFVFKWEAGHQRRRGRQTPSQRVHKPTKVFLKLEDLRPASVLPAAEIEQVIDKLEPSELRGIVQRRMNLPEKKYGATPKYIGRGRLPKRKAEIASETVEIHRRLHLIRQS